MPHSFRMMFLGLGMPHRVRIVPLGLGMPHRIRMIPPWPGATGSTGQFGQLRRAAAKGPSPSPEQDGTSGRAQ